MKDKRYIVIVNGVLKLKSGEKIKKGGLLPPDTLKDEIDEKLERGFIAEFDEKLTAKVQAEKQKEVSLIKELEGRLKNLQVENGNLKKENEELKKEIEDLLSEPVKKEVKK